MISKYWAVLLVAILLGALSGRAAQSTPETLVPDDALLVLAIPYFPDAKAAFLSDPFIRMFQDAAMKEYANKVKSTWQTRVVDELEKQFGIRLNEYTELLNGQLTMALFMDMDQGFSRPDVDLLLALDSGDKSAQLEAKLEHLRKRFSEAGQSLQPMTIRNESFYRLKPGSPSDASPRGPARLAEEVLIGQTGSLLLAATSASVIERSLASASGGSVRSISTHPAFRQVHAKRFEDAYGYGWLNFAEVYRMIEVQVKNMERQFTRNANPMIPKPTAVLDVLGLDGIQGLSFNLKELGSGSMFEFSLAAPEGDRRGIFELFAMSEKDSSPLQRVPANAMSFSRVRLNLGKLWKNLERMVTELSPLAGGMLESMLGELGNGHDASFDFRESFFGNLGDDLVTIGLPPRSSELQDLASPPALTLLGSPDPDALAHALIVVTRLILSGGNALSERKFQGRTIYSFTIPGLPIQGAARGGVGADFCMAADGDYLVFSMDERTLEDYLRGPSPSQRSLRSVPGLSQAVQALGSEKLTFFHYDNAVDLVRRFWELGRENSDLLSEGFAAGGLGGSQSPFDGFGDLADFSALPPFDRVAKYFHFSVGGGSSDAQFLNYRFFRPTPPQLR